MIEIGSNNVGKNDDFSIIKAGFFVWLHSIEVFFSKSLRFFLKFQTCLPFFNTPSCQQHTLLTCSPQLVIHHHLILGKERVKWTGHYNEFTCWPSFHCWVPREEGLLSKLCFAVVIGSQQLHCPGEDDVSASGILGVDLILGAVVALGQRHRQRCLVVLRLRMLWNIDCLNIVRKNRCKNTPNYSEANCLKLPLQNISSIYPMRLLYNRNLFQIVAGELPGAQVEVWYPRGVVDGAIGYRENISGRVAGHSWTVGCHRRPFWGGCQKKNKFTPGCIAELRDCGASSLRLFVLVYFNFTIVFELKFGLSVTSYSRKLVQNWWSLKWSGCNFKKYF